MIIEFGFLKFDITADKVGMLGANAQSANTLSDVRYSAFAIPVRADSTRTPFDFLTARTPIVLRSRRVHPRLSTTFARIVRASLTCSAVRSTR